MAFLKSPKRTRSADLLVLFSVGLLIIFGLVMLASASSYLGQRDFGDSYFYLKKQIYFGFLVGLIGFWIASSVYYGFWRQKWVSTTLLILSIIALLLVFTPLGFSAKGATRWLDIGGLSMQPSEFLKITLVLYLAAWLSSKDFRQKTFKAGYVPFAIIIGIVASILFIQNSTSPVIILIGASLAMYLMSGAKWRYVGLTVTLGLLAVVLLIVVTPYRAQRVLNYLNPEADPRGSGYHLIQSKMAIGAGGLTGVGYGQSIVKYRLPEPIGDSIFAVIAEEFGFVGVCFLLALFILLILRIFMLAKTTSDSFGRLLLVGFGSIIAIQVLINIGAMSGALPLTGTPLPFISYGGTALAVYMTMAGVIANITKYH